MKTIKYLCLTTTLLFMLIVMPVQNVVATSVAIFNSIPDPLPGNLPSQPYQAQQATEVGDYIQFAGTARNLSSVTVTMSSWAMHSEYPDMPTEGFTHPLTLNIYNVDKSGGTPALGSLIKTVTKNFVMQWRPAEDPINCPTKTDPGYAYKWQSTPGAPDTNCYNGFVFNVVFDLSSEGITLPDEIIYGIASNTQTYGNPPIGVPGPYNSLNFALNTAAPSVGTDGEPDAVFWNTITAGWYADGGASGTGIFRRDTGWTGYVPAIRFDVEEEVASPTMTVEVKDSLSNPIQGAVITYAVGSPNAGWQTFGITGADGKITRSDLMVGTDYHFYASYNTSNSLTQVVSFDGDDVVTFQTVPVKAKVETCTGAAIEGAVVTYGNPNGGFTSFGTTDINGVALKELFPGYERHFYAGVNHTSSALQAVTVADQVDPLVVFKTTAVTINYTGSINHGSANGGWYPFNKPTMEMFAGTHTFLVNGTQVPVQVSGCTLTSGNLTVKFPGIGSVHTYLKKSDGVAGTATGQQIGEQLYKNDQAIFANVLNGVYDLVVVKNSKSMVLDNVIVIGDKTVENIVATLTVNFPGVSSVHSYIKLDDGVAGTVGGAVDERLYKNETTSLAVLKGMYDVVVVKNAKQLIVDDVDCTGDTCTVENIVKTMTVNFPGISSVHSYVKLDDAVANAAGGGAVDERLYKNETTSLAVLKGMYDVIVVKNAKQLIVDAVDCTDSGTCTVDNIVATLTVNFPGVSSVHSYIKLDDGVAGTVGGAVDERLYKNETTSLAVLKGMYDVIVVKNAKQLIVDAVNCTGNTCTVENIVKTMTINFPGISSVHSYVKLDDAVANTAGGGAVDERLYKNEATSLAVLKGMYDVVVVKNAKQLIVDAVDCTDSGTCTVDNIVATLTIKFPGMTSVHSYVKLPDGTVNSATGGAVDERLYKNSEVSLAVLRSFYDVLLTKGSEAFIYDNVDCTGTICLLDKANLTVKFPGISSVHTYVKKSDGVAGAANGVQVAAQTYKNDQAVFPNLANGVYDVVVVKGAKTKIIDNVTVLGGWATVDKIVATLTVKFPGISSVHTYVKVDNGVAGTATGGDVENRTYKNDEATMVVLKNTYDIVVVKGAKNKIIDAVNCTGDTCVVEDIVATLTVKFPGISSVHSYVKVNDGAIGTATGGDVENRTYKTDEASMVVLKNTYDVVVVKGAKNKIIDAVDCTGNTCTVENIVATLTVKFPGISSVHTYVKVNDSVAGTATGGDVENRTYKNDEATMVVLKNTYDVVVVKGAKNKIIDEVDCTGNICTVENIVATLTVKFPGISSVHTYVKVNDGVVGTAIGGDVENRTYKTDEATMVVLKNTYDVVVVKGAKNKIIDAVDCYNDTCVVENIVATLTVQFPGISSVHTYVKTNDNAIGTAIGGDVENRTYKNNEATMVVLKNTYDVVVVKGAKNKIIDAVDCTGDTCLISNIVATFTLHFPGKSSVHTYVKVNDGVAGTAAGGDVENRTYQNNSTTMVLLKNTYDVVVKIGADTHNLDDIDCTGNTCVYSLAVIKLLNSNNAGIPGGAAKWYNGTWHTIGNTNANGVITLGIPVAPGNLLFSMDYAFTHEEKWQNTATNFVVVFQTKNVEVQLQNSTGALMDTGFARYYTGAWHDIGNTSSGKVNIELLPANIDFSMDNNFVHNEKWQHVGTNPVVIFQTKNVEVQLKDSTDNFMDTGFVRYYTGAWHDIGNTTDGRVNIELLPANIDFSMDNNFVHNEKWQNTSADPVVVFQTRNVEVQLKDSHNNFIDTGFVRYYTGAWHDIGNTSGGKVNIELLPANIDFSMDNNFVHNEKWQNTGVDETVVFQTKNVVVQLQDHNGNALDTGTVKYYTGSWHDFGTTSGGQASLELLPANILFSMDYGFTHAEKWQNVDPTPTVVFQTGQVNSGTGTCTQYYTGSWHPFTSGMELLSANILFDFSDTQPDAWFTPLAGGVNNIH